MSQLDSLLVSDIQPQDMVDLGRYPILDLANAKDIIERGRAELAKNGTCVLPGFLKLDVVKRLAREAEELSPKAYHSTVEGNAYLTAEDTTLPIEHAQRLKDTTALGALAYDLIPHEAGIRRLYEWNPLLEFIGALLNKPKLYRYADPMGALNIAVMGEGDYLRWHFDQTDFVTSIALQESETGGDFEYAPMIRSAKNENFEGVKKILKGSTEGVHRLPMDPGTLVLFEGRHSIHRVTRIGGKRLRLVALLGYDTRPDVNSSEYLRYLRYGRKK